MCWFPYKINSLFVRLPSPALNGIKSPCAHHPWTPPSSPWSANRDHTKFLFELKHDGFRALAYVVGGHCELISRRRNSYKRFGELRRHLGELKVKNAVIDGELVCLVSEGRNILNELLLRKGCPIFYAFDLLYLNGRDLSQLPLIERKETVRARIANGGHILTGTTKSFASNLRSPY
jgi:ATP-dependent DNA ligase